MYRRIAAMDISKRSTGLVFSNEDCEFVAHEYVFDTRTEKGLRIMKDAFAKHQPLCTYIGFPRKLDGNYSQNTNFVKLFTHSYRHVIGRYVFLDERMTTNLSEYIALSEKSSKSLDIISARILLVNGMSLFKMKHEDVKLD